MLRVCSLFWQQKREPEKTAAVSTQRTHDQGLLAPWNPKEEGRGRAGLKNRQDTFFDAPPTRSRLTAPPIKLRKLVFALLFPSYGWFVGRGLDPSLPPCGYCNNQKPPPRRGGALPRPRSNGGAKITGYSVGAAYMPPAAAIPTMQPTRQPPRDASMRPLQTCRKFAFPQLLLTSRLFVGRGLDPSLPPCGYCNNQKPPPRRGGACPARGFTATVILRVGL